MKITYSKEIEMYWLELEHGGVRIPFDSIKDDYSIENVVLLQDKLTVVGSLWNESSFEFLNAWDALVLESA